MSEDAVPGPILPQDGCKRQPPHARFRITLEREAQLTDLVRWMSSVTCERSLTTTASPRAVCAVVTMYCLTVLVW